MDTLLHLNLEGKQSYTWIDENLDGSNSMDENLDGENSMGENLDGENSMDENLDG